MVARDIPIHMSYYTIYIGMSQAQTLKKTQIPLAIL
jgi:hypothetical protein